MTLEHLPELKEYITKRKEAFESKILGTVNPFENMHFCNNSKHLDSTSQAIIKSTLKLVEEGRSLDYQLFNVVCYRVVVDKKSIFDMTDGENIFRPENMEKYVAFVKGDKEQPKGRYHLTLQNEYLWKVPRHVIFEQVVTDTVAKLPDFVGANQAEIFLDKQFRKIRGVGEFLAYQLSSDLLYVPAMEVKVSFVPYHSAGTGKGFEIITGSKNYDEMLIGMILSMNSVLTHKTKYTKNMIPSDACNVLCEFTKYMSGKKRSRSEALGANYNTILFGYEELITPESIEEWVAVDWQK